MRTVSFHRRQQPHHLHRLEARRDDLEEEADDVFRVLWTVRVVRDEGCAAPQGLSH